MRPVLHHPVVPPDDLLPTQWLTATGLTAVRLLKDLRSKVGVASQYLFIH
jgi:hypothetical protein